LKALRILIITHSPLLAELGASQVAMNLGEALKEFYCVVSSALTTAYKVVADASALAR
jgi:hypothetical protein